MHVMRVPKGGEVVLFNGCNGEWLACVMDIGRQGCTLSVRAQLRQQTDGSADVWLLFAPLKRLHIDLLAEKACELGVSVLWPLFTQHTAVTRVNTDRLRLQVVKAAEQCGRLTVPEVRQPIAALDQVLVHWPVERRLIVCDESGHGESVTAAMTSIGPGPVAILVGPEGGLAKTELDLLRILPFATRVSLGSLVLRAETAALAALVCWQALCGDWRVSFYQRT
ncbi:Ribosomal RNA small subunit methyltransferase E [invertebrate metagenome]|uniref:16S rRNA (uracil(1498)-N(3))-methyltransferase n=1 Tax=invertebrate metagenome TaxID=1711999 RepID=A0A484HAZ5_9ZZZZ